MKTLNILKQVVVLSLVAAAFIFTYPATSSNIYIMSVLPGVEYNYDTETLENVLIMNASADGFIENSTTLELWWANGSSWESRLSRITTRTVPASTTPMPWGEYWWYLYDFEPATRFTSPPKGATSLLLVADPENIVPETDEGDNIGVYTIYYSISSDFIQRNQSTGGIDFQYTVARRLLGDWTPPHSETEALLFWASGPRAEDRLSETPIFTQIIPGSTEPVTTMVHVDASLLNNPPDGTTCVQLVLDPDELLYDPDRTDNILTVAFGDLIAEKMEWNPATQGLDILYSIQASSSEIVPATTAALYWTKGPRETDWISGSPSEPFYSVDIPESHSSVANAVIHVPTEALNEIPSGATHVVLVLDDLNEFTELVETNNSTFLQRRIHVISVGENYADGIYGGELARRVSSAFADEILWPQVTTNKCLVMAEIAGIDADDFVRWVFDQIDDVANQIVPGDTLVFYINAHGGQQEYWAPYAPHIHLRESKKNVVIPGDNGDQTLEDNQENESLLFRDSKGFSYEIPDDMLREAFEKDNRWRSVNKVFVIDACYGGGFWGDFEDFPRTAVISPATEEKATVAGGDIRLSFLYLRLKYTSNFGRAFVRAISNPKAIGPSLPRLLDAVHEEAKVFEGIPGLVLGGFPCNTMTNPIPYDPVVSWSATADFSWDVAVSDITTVNNGITILIRPYFTEAEILTDPTIIEFDADPDRDGVGNFAEVAFLSNPKIADSGSRPVETIIVEIPGERHPAVAFWRRPSSAGIFYRVMKSNDLAQWVPATGDFEVLEETAEGQRVRFILDQKADDWPKLFLRVEAQAVGAN